IKKSDDNHKKVLEIKELISLKETQDKKLKAEKEKLTSLNENVLNTQKNYIQSLANQNFDNNNLISDKEKEFLNFEVEVNALSNDYQNSYNNYLKMQAGIIAQTLEDNKPCPVCGALKHLNPAKLENENLTKEVVDNLKANLDESNLLLAKKSNDISILKEKNETLLKLISSFSKKFKIDIPTVKTNVKNIDFEEELLNLEEKINFQNDLIKKLEQEFVALQSKIDLISKEIKFDDIDLIIENHKSLVKKYDDEQSLIEKIEKDYQAKSLDLSSSLSNLDLLNKQILEYNNIDETKIDTLNNFIEEKASEIEKIDGSIKQIFSRKSINEKILTSLNSKNKDFIAVSKKYLNYKILSECANGALKGKARLAFEQYIQGYYLDLVLYEANKHLKTMTNGQFQIFRKKEASSMQSKTGLELEVMDFYTYKRRSTKTLSGGESFKAALALALGLSDCVSNFSGAINIEAMFIDEGFGSLDSESLDLAMDVIFNLSSNNRLIGLISHIDDLKLKIQNQIQTYKSDKGSRIEINF
ncbi:MAG: hypothetical protein IJW73_04160, partial [Candidatus Gastranaerophilales bacterium]|nr:hypothetical protein [Candidatus Gastranaerophilales bacterium]